MLQPIVTQRLILRSLSASDAEAVFSYRSHPEILRFQSWEPSSVEEVRTFLASLQNRELLTPGMWFQIGITLRASGETVGDCGVHARADDSRQVELGITLAPSSQRKCLALEALSALLDYLLTQTETHRVFCSVDPQNQRCLKLLEKVGMRREAHLRESLWIKGAWVDEVVYAILKKDWKKPTEPNPALSS